MKDIKELYARFRKWQQDPFEYELIDNETCHCQNCGNSFTGNYCPYCSQKRGLGRFTWDSVHKAILEPWGMHGRSMLYTIWQLLFRPGYLIRDYISGKRQVSFPPVKMLFIIAAIVAFIEHNIVSEKAAATVAKIQIDTTDYKSLVIGFSKVIDWYQDNLAWGTLISCFFLVIPTWIFFRNAPRYPRHTLPEGFFIQVFISTLSLVYNFFSDLIYKEVNTLFMISLFFAYYQLFGYKIWGTIWRLTLAFSGGVVATTFALLTATTAGLVIKDELQDTEMFIIMMISCCSLLFFTVIYLGISYLIIFRGKPKEVAVTIDEPNNQNTQI